MTTHSVKKDIHKLADYLIKVTRDGVAAEKNFLEWEQAEEKRTVATPVSKSS